MKFIFNSTGKNFNFQETLDTQVHTYMNTQASATVKGKKPIFQPQKTDVLLYEILKKNTIACALGVMENYQQSLKKQMGESIYLNEQDIGGIFMKRKIQTNSYLDQLLYGLRFFKADYQKIEFQFNSNLP